MITGVEVRRAHEKEPAMVSQNEPTYTEAEVTEKLAAELPRRGSNNAGPFET